jgi:hypothetical protein
MLGLVDSDGEGGAEDVALVGRVAQLSGGSSLKSQISCDIQSYAPESLV